MPSSCPKGMIRRESYNKKTGTKVKSVCVKDMGKPGNGPKLIVMPAEVVGLLGDFGYSLKKTHEERIKALKRACKKHEMLKILRHVNALRTLFKSNESYYKKLDKDMKWIQKHYKNCVRKDLTRREPVH
jgi:hypothetical protein